jgi:tetratricopeptide (TPR) repeat protein
MATHRLQTLGGILLDGVALDEPRLAALLVLLGIAGDEGVAEPELLLRLAPDLTAEKGRAEVARLVARSRSLLGGDSAITRTVDRYAVAPGTMALDVRTLAAPVERECSEFLAGFKFPGNPEFREWVAATRHRVVAADRSVGATVSRVTIGDNLRRWKIGALMLALAAGAIWLAQPRHVDGFATGDPVLLSDIRNETGDSLFDSGLLSAASIALQQSGKLRLWPRSRLGEVYRLMKVTNRDTALTFDLAQEVAERDHVRFVLGLHIERAGEGYRLTGRLADVQRKNPVIETSEAVTSKGEVLAALDRLLLTMRARLGESRGEIAERQMPLPLVTTSSLEALRSYAEGSGAWVHGNYRLAGELWQRAIDIDTGFAMAYGALGNFYYYSHDRANGERYYSEALRRASRLTERERLWMLDGLADYRGNLDSSAVLSRLLVLRYPSITTWYNYGTTLLQGRRHEEAIAAFRTGLTYDSSNVNSWVNLATASSALDRSEDALRYYARARKIDSLALYRNNVNHEWGGTFVRLGRLAEAESVFRRMSTSGSVADRALGLRSLGFLAHWRGQVDGAIGYFAEAMAAAAQIPSPLGEARSRLLLATAYRTAGREREAGVEVTRVLSQVSSPYFEPRFLAMLANNCLQLGRVADAEAVLKQLRTRRDTASAADRAAEAFVAGAVQLARHHPDSALVLARRAGSVPQAVPVLMLEADAFRALGKGDSALVTLQRLMNERAFGLEGQDEWLRAPLLLGDLLLARGDSTGARKAYERLVDHWRLAPPALPDLVAARSRLAVLDGAARQR